jgi:trehalose/maltose transport system substrate-binding protein
MYRCRLFLYGVALAWSAGAWSATISVSCGAVGQELELCRSAARTWGQRTGNAVEVVSTPADASERLALYQQLLGSQSDRIDVLQIDVVWPGLLARHLLDLRPYAQHEVPAHFERLIANNTVEGRLVALPWFANAGLLYFRKDLLDKYRQPVPGTWSELAATAQKIQDAERAAGNRRFWGFVWQGRAYEGLTCDALEWVASYGGGTVVDAAGAVTIDNPSAAAALREAASWVRRITPVAVLNYGEEQARGVFQSGNALFMRNWPYAWSLAQGADSPVRGKVGIALLPRGGAAGRHAATLGGESLAVSRYSRNPALAADLVLFLTSAAQQKQRALAASFYPSRPAVYQDADVLERNPFMQELLQTLQGAVARPAGATGTRYNQVSHEFWNTVHSVLSGRMQVDSALAELKRRLQRISRGGRWK